VYDRRQITEAVMYFLQAGTSKWHPRELRYSVIRRLTGIGNNTCFIDFDAVEGLSRAIRDVVAELHDRGDIIADDDLFISLNPLHRSFNP